MSVEITIPSIGVAMSEATIVEWLKQPGDDVALDEAVLEIETDKASTELTSPAAGTLGAHLAAAGDVVNVGAAVARVLQPGESEAAPAPTVAAADGAGEVESQVAGTPAPAEREPGATRHTLSPRARRLAAQQARDEPARGEDRGSGQRSGSRRQIAAATLEAWRTIPHFAVTRALDGAPLVAALARARAGAEVRITMTDLLLRALARALAATSSDGGVALAVATPGGVFNPVIPGLLERTLAELAVARAAAVERARAGRLTAEDAADAATTLSNLGTAEVDHFTGIVTPGQRTLVTVGALAKRPVVRDDALAVGTTFHVTINADHRVLDGADAAALLAAFAAVVTDEDGLLEDGRGIT